jgi:hypothetical protein
MESNPPPVRSPRRRWLRRMLRWLIAILLAILCLFAISNLFFSTHTAQPDRLSLLDKARVTEALRLRRAFGDSIWKGWGKAEIPVIIYNEEYAFLVGLGNPAPGWRKVPQGIPRGTYWEPIAGDSIEGGRYYRQRLPDEHATPQAFTVRVGDRWVASLATKEWTGVKIGNEIRDGLPPLVRYIAPYRLIARIFLGLALNTDNYICGIGHESFHAFEGMVDSARLADAETVMGRFGRRYPWKDPSFNSAWSAELNALAGALEAKDGESAAVLGRKFLSLRRDRRLSAHLDSTLVKLEQQREWEEGLAKYTELAIWEHAAADSAYRPFSVLGGDTDFHGFRTFGKRWSEELATLRFQSHGEDTRFYYAGMAQAFLLDRCTHAWRTRALREGGVLEDLLNEQCTPSSGQSSP